MAHPCFKFFSNIFFFKLCFAWDCANVYEKWINSKSTFRPIGFASLQHLFHPYPNNLGLGGPQAWSRVLGGVKQNDLMCASTLPKPNLLLSRGSLPSFMVGAPPHTPISTYSPSPHKLVESLKALTKPSPTSRLPILTSSSPWEEIFNQKVPILNSGTLPPRGPFIGGFSPTPHSYL